MVFLRKLKRKLFGLKLEHPKIDEVKIDDRSRTFDLMTKHILDNISKEELEEHIKEYEVKTLLDK